MKNNKNSNTGVAKLKIYILFKFPSTFGLNSTAPSSENIFNKGHSIHLNTIY